ncbi:DISARM system phospholipase D-like protein DrmC [Streptomyces sp. TR06-5]|uniref:DISARM system phospholipase D-like protein DrmC n=1 Tax=Streptomyces sp. TR06-5 TaxID=3385976 RepID=UPI00399F983D
MSRRRFEAAAARAAAALSAPLCKDLAGLLAQGRTIEHTQAVLGTATAYEAVTALFESADAEGVSGAEAAAYLRGYVAGSLQQRDEVRVQAVWSGPATASVPVRATGQVLAQIVREARHELLAMTYAARPYETLTRALTDAVRRGVDVHVVVETLSGAAGLLSGSEPATAFASIPGLKLWHWAHEARPLGSARQHAKLAVADERTLFVGSANLTEAAARRNIEAGVLVHGGTAPRRASEHVRELQRQQTLQKWEA